MEKILFKGKKREEVKKRNGIGSFIIQIVFYVLSGFLLYNVGKSVDITMKKLGILSQAQVEVDQLRLKNIELILEQDRVESKDYVETEARNRLNYAKNGDLLYVIPESVLQRNMKRVDAFLNESDSNLRKKTSREIWYEFFVSGV